MYTNVTPFEAHFCRKRTSIINISTTPNSKNLKYEQILNPYLDADTVPVEEIAPLLIISAATYVATPSTSTAKGNRRAHSYYGFERSVCSVSETKSISVGKRQRTKNTVIAKIIQ